MYNRLPFYSQILLHQVVKQILIRLCHCFTCNFKLFYGLWLHITGYTRDSNVRNHNSTYCQVSYTLSDGRQGVISIDKMASLLVAKRSDVCIHDSWLHPTSN